MIWNVVRISNKSGVVLCVLIFVLCDPDLNLQYAVR